MPKTLVYGTDREEADVLIDISGRLTARLVRDAVRFCGRRGKGEADITMMSFMLLQLMTHRMLREVPKSKQLDMLRALHNGIEMELLHGDAMHGLKLDA